MGVCVVRVALELIPTLEGLPGNDTPQGNTEHLGSHLLEKMHPWQGQNWLVGFHLCHPHYNGFVVVFGLRMGIKACLGKGI